MPDPAIEAYKAGIPYTEPTGKGIKKARVSYEYVADPYNPTAPPRARRVIEPATSGGGPFSKWWKGSGGDAAAFKPVPMQAAPAPAPIPNAMTYDWLGRPKYPKAQPQPRYLPQPTPQTHSLDAQPQWATPPVLLQPTPLPPNIDQMPWGERRYWLKMRDEQIKGIKLMEKAAKDQRKAQEKERKIRLKAEEKQRKRELKAREKELRWLRKNPYRQLPFPSQTYPYSAQTAPAATPAAAKPGPAAEPLSFMLPSTGEEFGLRRPFDAPGLPRTLGGPPGQAGWPMMSRTMTHAVQDLTREERVHAIQGGRAWAPNW